MGVPRSLGGQRGGAIGAARAAAWLGVDKLAIDMGGLRGGEMEDSGWKAIIAPSAGWRKARQQRRDPALVQNHRIVQGDFLVKWVAHSTPRRPAAVSSCR